MPKEENQTVPSVERGAAEGERERVAEPHPITRSFLAGWEPGESAFSLSFINLTTCAKSPGIRVNQTDIDTLAAVFWVTWEAHPGPCCCRCRRCTHEVCVCLQSHTLGS